MYCLEILHVIGPWFNILLFEFSLKTQRTSLLAVGAAVAPFASMQKFVRESANEKSRLVQHVKAQARRMQLTSKPLGGGPSKSGRAALRWVGLPRDAVEQGDDIFDKVSCRDILSNRVSHHAIWPPPSLPT